jgi:mono/diheme cytochrome c family protein
MVLKIATFVFASSLLLACNNSGNKFSTSEKTNSQQEIDADQAKGLYSIHCASCHGENGKLGMAEAADLSTSSIPLTDVEQMIEKGNDKGMIPYEGILSKGEVKGVAKYVLTLRK